MNLTSAPFFRNKLSCCAQQFCRVLPVSLVIFLLPASTALAEPVRVNQVVQTLTSSQGVPDLKLNTLVSQDPAKSSAQQSGPGNESTSGGTQGEAKTKTDSLLSGVAVISEGQKLGVEVVEEGEVEGTICDCGEILIAGGSFPKWPFLFLAAVPLAFINDCDDCSDVPSSTPTPPINITPTPPGVPEPASLLLFGTGLVVAGAGLRRHYARAKPSDQRKAQEEE